MKRDPRMYLWEARDAADHIRSFLLNRAFDEYLNDVMLRSAVEQQFEIIGEALNQLSKTAPTLAARLPDTPRAISFRNRLIHGYMDTDHRVVWSIAHDDLSRLRDSVQALLQEPGEAS